MDWANEKYVRIFTRDTPEWLVLPWQAKALWPLMVRKFDRSGVLATRLGARGVAVLVGLPLEVVEPGIAALLEDGCLELHELGYLSPNYLEAQETPQSDANRQRESRERRRSRKCLSPGSCDVVETTECHAVSRGVTSGHAASQHVTPDQTSPDQKERADRAAISPAPYPEANGMVANGGIAMAPPVPPAPVAKPQRSAPRRALDPAWEPSRTESILAAESAASARGVDVASELAQLRDWAAGNGERKADWDATWRGWLRRARPTSGSGQRQWNSNPNQTQIRKTTLL